MRHRGIVGVMGFLFFFIVGGVAAEAQILFEYRGDVVAGDCPIGVVVADFNEDGRMDVAMSDYHLNNGRLLIGDGTGGFTTQPTFGAAVRPYHLATADFNLDGHLDTAIANCISNTVSVLLGNGSGGFSGPTQVPVGVAPQFAAVGDFDGNGIPDMAVANSESTFVTILLGDGFGGFSRHDTAYSCCPAIAAAIDANEDGFDDVVFTGPPALFISDGAGGFSAVTPLSAIGFTATADMDADGHLDLVAATPGGLSVLFGDGTGSFPEVSSVVFPESASAITTADFDADGIFDFAANNYTTGAVVVVRGLGGRQFAFFPIATIEPNGPYAIASGDLNGDTLPDLVTVNLTHHSVSVLINHSDEACRAGNVNAAAGPVADVLLVNGSAGAIFSRAVTMPVGGNLAIDVLNAPSRVRSSYAIFVAFGEPTLATKTAQRFSLGTMSFPTPLDDSILTVTLANTMGHESQLGSQLLRAALPTAPVRILDTVVRNPFTITLQGFLRDDASISPLGVAITNAVVVRVE